MISSSLDDDRDRKAVVLVTPEMKRQVALDRVAQLRGSIRDYLDYCGQEKQAANQPDLERQTQAVCRALGAGAGQWHDWKWHMSHRLTQDNLHLLGGILDLPDREMEEIRLVSRSFRWAVSPYYLSLIQPGDPRDPIRLQALPSIWEVMDQTGKEDPMAEEYTSPAACITRRYPDRLIINVTNRCAMYCRHCQRRRNIGEVDRHRTLGDLNEALAYVRANSEIRDVLITGGDALMLSDQRLDWLLSELDRIPQVEIKRLGTRVPVTLPQRVTEQLCSVLAQHPPIYLNTQFNHPREITPEAKAACDRLVQAGVVLGNQSVLLRGVNDDPLVMRQLNQDLLRLRVRPYYLFHAKQVKGTAHFVTSIDKGLQIMESLRGATSGLAIPTYVVNAPNGYGKVPLLPQYLLGKDEGKVWLRTWEGHTLEYPNRESGR